MNIGIFGGTFDPPHLGHVIVAEHVGCELSLEKVLFVPAAIPPHKVYDGITSSHHRLAMLQLAIRDNPRFDISAMEIDRGGVSFTVDTLRELRNRYPADHLFLLIGMDNLLEFHTWKSPEEILSLAGVVVMTRPGFSVNDVPASMRDVVTMCPVPEIGIASREVRRRVRGRKSIRYLVSADVETYIARHGLYLTAEE